MRSFIKRLRIWNIVGLVSAINGMVCFGLSSTYNMSFGKLGIGGLLFYVLLCLTMWHLIMWGKRIRVPEKVQGLSDIMRLWLTPTSGAAAHMALSDSGAVALRG